MHKINIERARSAAYDERKARADEGGKCDLISLAIAGKGYLSVTYEESRLDLRKNEGKPCRALLDACRQLVGRIGEEAADQPFYLAVAQKIAVLLDRLSAVLAFAKYRIKIPARVADEILAEVHLREIQLHTLVWGK